MPKSFEKYAQLPPAPARTQRQFPVWVVVRHTRGGDEFKKVIVLKASSNPDLMRQP